MERNSFVVVSSSGSMEILLDVVLDYLLDKWIFPPCARVVVGGSPTALA